MDSLMPINKIPSFPPVKTSENEQFDYQYALNRLQNSPFKRLLEKQQQNATS